MLVRHLCLLFISCVLSIFCNCASAQSAISSPGKKDLTKENITSPKTDSQKKSLDTAILNVVSSIQSAKSNLISQGKSLKNDLLLPSKPNFTFKDSLSINKKVLNEVKSKPFLSFNGAYFAYNFTYRSNLDTPFAQKNFMQHVGNGYFNFSIAEMVPIRLSYLIRSGNSIYFNDIYDFRVEFDATAFRNQVAGSFKEQLSNSIEQYRDSTTEKLYKSKLAEINNLKKWFEDPFTNQRLYEMNEIVRMPSITYDRTLPDSIASMRSDSLQRLAKFFLEQYETKKLQYESMLGKKDSLKREFEHSKARIDELKNIAKGNYAGWKSLKNWKNELGQISGNRIQIPKQYEWLLGIRNMSIGKTWLNHSELTTKNLGLKGINFEYNTWYYFAFSAGLIDYRFKDFNFESFKKVPQHLYMLRLGLGELERNYFIVSAFKGQKQLYAASNPSKGVQPISISGTAIEGRIQFAKSSFLVAEAGQSFSNGISADSSGKTRFWNLSDKRNKAVSFRLYSYIPQTRSRIDGLYKYTGPNYQSFSTFQPNAAFTSWYVRLDQNFLKRTLKIVASLKSNEFSNPYVIQNYKSTNIFKSVMLTYRRRKMPTLNIGYTPASQFIRLENYILESKFQTLNASLNHIYKLGTKQSATSIVFNKFYNNSADSGFTYFNAVNFVLGQTFFFKTFNASLSLIETKNPTYKLNVLDGNVQVPINSKGSFGLGAKVNTLNKSDVKIGYYGNVQMRFGKNDLGFISFEKGYLTGPTNQLTQNDFLNIGISKYFK